MGRPKKLKELNQVNGQNRQAPVTSATIDAIFGNTGLSKYGTLNLEEFKKKIQDMQPSELFEFAGNYGIRGADLSDKAERDRVVANLVDDFKLHAARYLAADNLPPKQTSKADAAKIEKLLKEGL